MLFLWKSAVALQIFCHVTSWLTDGFKLQAKLLPEGI